MKVKTETRKALRTDATTGFKKNNNKNTEVEEQTVTCVLFKITFQRISHLAPRLNLLQFQL